MATSNLSKVQKYVAVAVGLGGIVSMLISGAKYYVDTKTENTVAPVSTKLNEHIETAGHAIELERLKQVSEDLSYIRGQLDAHWGQLDSKQQPSQTGPVGHRR